MVWIISWSGLLIISQPNQLEPMAFPKSTRTLTTCHLSVPLLIRLAPHINRLPSILQDFSRTLKKLILDCCTKTPFSINGQLFKQTDGVAMGSPLGPTLANIIMTVFEDEIVRKLIDSNVIKFYARYVDR